jgi:predicted RNA binding protein YcfA (HicA-like mRNA interferase family)
MSKLPRDVRGERLAAALEKIGYRIVRQTGSHIRLKGGVSGEDPVTVPRHDPIKVGTLSSILDDVVKQTGIAREQLLRLLRR